MLRRHHLLFRQTKGNSNAILHRQHLVGEAVALMWGLLILPCLDTFEALDISKLSPKRSVFINSKRRNEHIYTVLSLI